MQIYGFNKTTLLDYPGCLAAVVFTGGCNFCCPFCHNGSLVLNPGGTPLISEEEVLAVMEKRRKILEGVCITGGEPTLQADLPEFILKVKRLGLKVKLDTNGTRPELLREWIEEGLLDYIAMDIKNTKKKYPLTTGRPQPELEKVEESIRILMNAGVDYEFRTTVVKEFHTLSDMEEIGHWVKGAARYYLQSFRDSEGVIRSGLHAHTPAVLNKFRERLEKFVPHVEIRGL